MTKFFLLISFTFFTTNIFSDEDHINVSTGQIWALESRSNSSSLTNSKVLYFFSNDAYNTYQARRFSDWDSFSIIDARNLTRLNTGDRLEIINSKHNDIVFEVKLINGYMKNKKHFIIKEDLLNDFTLEKKL
tara:strand:- start:13345 stop:13740 length:396 start_codon:yes stop_codon:yes gene_type:complete